MNSESSISPVLARSLAFSAVMACIGLAILVAVLAMRWLDGEWGVVATTAVVALAVLAVALIRLVLLAVDSLLDRAHPAEPGHGRGAP